MGSSGERHGLSPAGALSLLAIVGVLVLVSLPRLHDFALQENEADAAALTRVLGTRLGQATEPGSSLADLVESAGLEALRDDIEWVDDGRFLRRHGYLFELALGPNGAAVRAWPWAHGDTGRAAFLFVVHEGVFRHGNGSGRWTGPSHPPEADGPGWVVFAAPVDTQAF